MFDIGAVKHSFGRYAAQYDEYAYLQKQVRNRALTLAKQYFPKHARVLDAGCGTAAMCKEARSNNWDIANLDIAFGMCREAQAHGHCIINADVAAMPFADGKFDGIFSSLMLQWVNDMQTAFAEIARVLTPGGHAVIATLAEGTLDELRQAFSVVDNKAHVSEFFPPHYLLKVADSVGLELVSARQDSVTEKYPDAVSLMRSLQAIGASNKHDNRPRGLTTPSRFARLECAYDKNADGTLPATWKILYLVVKKPV